MVDVVGRYVGEVGVRGVLLHVEFVDEVEEYGVLLGRGYLMGRAEGAGGDVGGLVMVRAGGAGGCEG